MLQTVCLSDCVRRTQLFQWLFLWTTGCNTIKALEEGLKWALLYSHLLLPNEYKRFLLSRSHPDISCCQHTRVPEFRVGERPALFLFFFFLHPSDWFAGAEGQKWCPKVVVVCICVMPGEGFALQFWKWPDDKVYSLVCLNYTETLKWPMWISDRHGFSSESTEKPSAKTCTQKE